MKEGIIFFLALLTTIWLAVNVITGMVSAVKAGSDNTPWYSRFALIVIVSLLWTLVRMV